jgi:sugar phosphate isomerase/epimerase
MTWSIGVATGACPARPIGDVLATLHQAGVAGVELGTPPRHFDVWKAGEVDAVGDRLQQLPLRAVSIHAPFGESLDLAHPDPRHRQAGIDAALAAARTIKQLGGRIVVAHPSDLARHGADIAARLEASAASLRSVAAGCRRENVQLAIESPLPHLIGGHPDEFEWLLRHVDDGAGVCLDTGHIALGRSWRRFVEVAGDRLVHVHASDNYGQYDDHLPPGDGTIDWGEIAATLRQATSGGWMILELQCPGDDGSGYFRRAVAQAHALVGQGQSVHS